MLIIDVVPWEDASTQERALVDQVLPGVEPGDLGIEDRNFCTTRLVFGVRARGGSFLVRQHQLTLHWEEVTPWAASARDRSTSRCRPGCAPATPTARTRGGTASGPGPARWPAPGAGGKLVRQQGPRVFVADHQPAYLGPGPEPGLLDRVDLPDLVGGTGSRPGRRRALRPARPVDAGILEGALQDARGRHLLRVESREQLDADPPSPPAGVIPLKLAGPVEHGLGVGRGRAPAGVIADGQAVGPAVAEGAPEGADGVVGEPEFLGDLGQRLAAEVAIDDVLAEAGGTARGMGSLLGCRIVPAL
jgi:hypothetical protein